MKFVHQGEVYHGLSDAADGFVAYVTWFWPILTLVAVAIVFSGFIIIQALG